MVQAPVKQYIQDENGRKLIVSNEGNLNNYSCIWSKLGLYTGAGLYTWCFL